MIVIDIALILGSLTLAASAVWSARKLIRGHTKDMPGDDFLILLVYSSFLSFEGEPEIWIMRPFLASMTMFLAVWLACLSRILEYRTGRVWKAQQLTEYVSERELLKKYRLFIVVPKIAMFFTIIGAIGLSFESWHRFGRWIVVPIAGTYGLLLAILAMRYQLWRGEPVSGPSLPPASTTP